MEERRTQFAGESSPSSACEKQFLSVTLSPLVGRCDATAYSIKVLSCCAQHLQNAHCRENAPSESKFSARNKSSVPDAKSGSSKSIGKTLVVTDLRSSFVRFFVFPYNLPAYSDAKPYSLHFCVTVAF